MTAEFDNKTKDAGNFSSKTPKLDRLLNAVKSAIGKPQSQTGIEDPTALANALIDLRELIGNNELKEEVASQVSHLIVEQKRGTTDVGMLNILLSGPPGVGKTLISKTLARILISFGYLKTNTNAQKKPHQVQMDATMNFGQGQNLFDPNALYMSLIISILLWTFLFSLFKVGFLWVILGFVVTSALFYYLLKPHPTYLYEYMYGGGDNDNASKNSDKSKTPQKDIIRSVTRTDFVAQYMGQSAAKTRKLLNESLGKVLFVDEAYSLIQRADDSFGTEVLDELCLFMSEHPGEIIVVFAGYHDLIAGRIFTANPGLKSRFKWKFECSGYSTEELFDIFKTKLAARKWKIENEERVKQMFREQADAFPSFGRDVENLVDFSIMSHDESIVDLGEVGTADVFLLKSKHIMAGINRLRANQGEEVKPNFPKSSIEDLFRSLRGSELATE